MTAKTLYCNNVDKNYIPKHICKLKPTRNGTTLFTVMFYNVKPMTEIWMHTIFTIKYGQKFQTLGLDRKEDLCNLLKSDGTSGDTFSKLLFSQTKKVLPKSLVHPCPYQGTFGIENFNHGEIFERALPQVIPKGTYKAYVRLYRKSDNHTYIDGYSVSELRAVDFKQDIEFRRK